MSTATIKRRPRAEETTECIGPIGYLLGSPAEARLLALLVMRRYERFRFVDLLRHLGMAKRSLQTCLEQTAKAGLLVREGQAYRFAIESPLACSMADAIQISLQATRKPSAKSFADSIARWAGMPAGSATIDGPTVEHPMPESKRLAHFKQMPDTPVRNWTASEPSGAFAI